MMLLSGYTLGFFFPKQTLDRRGSPRTAGEDTSPPAAGDEPAARRPADDGAGAEVPASHYFYRYF